MGFLSSLNFAIGTPKMDCSQVIVSSALLSQTQKPVLCNISNMRDSISASGHFPTPRRKLEIQSAVDSIFD